MAFFDSGAGLTVWVRRGLGLAGLGLAGLGLALAVAIGVHRPVGALAAESDAALAEADLAALKADPQALASAFEHVEVASVSDALEQISGRRMYLSHRFAPLFTARWAGYALTVRLEKKENKDAHALDGMLGAIDHGAKGSVYVMSIEDGADIAGMGGLMGTAMAARGFKGALIDGAVRDTAYLRKIGFPVVAAGITPATSVGHYRFAGENLPITVDGVAIRPGDLISSDPDGVVVIPRELALDALARARQLDYSEHTMYALIEKMKSIEAAVRQFGRL